MKYIIGLMLFFVYGASSQEPTFIKQKNCEIVQLSSTLDIVSCDKFDYLVEYEQYDNKRTEVNKVTATNTQSSQVIFEKKESTGF